MQAALEGLARERLHALPERVSLAVVVADWRAWEVRALVSGGWGEEARAGALDLTRAVRSPGSALKPFLYALAFQDGAARPDTVLADLPRRFGDYAPHNFQRDFSGHVTAASALRQSLNLPAVALLLSSAATSRRDALAALCPSRARRSRSASPSPARMVPSMMAMVAGTAPSSRTKASTVRAISRFCGNGMPWVMMVDSSATTPTPALSAAPTSELMER